MIYKLLNRLFGWDYITWKNSADQGIARVFIRSTGVYYWRYKNIKILDEITDVNQVIWLTCDGDKCLPNINSHSTFNDSPLSIALKEFSAKLTKFNDLLKDFKVGITAPNDP